MGRPDAQFKEVAAFVEQQAKALADCQAFLCMLGSGGFRASALANRLFLRANRGQQLEQDRAICFGARGIGIKTGTDHILKLWAFGHS